MPNMSDKLARRSFLQTAAAAGVLGVTGCLGSESTGEGNTIWTTMASESSSYASVQGIASLVNEESDEVQMEAKPSKGTGANIGRLQRDEAHVAYTQSFDAVRVTEGMEPYDNLNFELNEVIHWMSSPFLFVTPHDWDSISDIGSDSRVSPAEEGAGTRDMLEKALGYVVDDYDATSVRFTQQAGPFQEGTLDVGIVPLMNGAIEGSYVEEQKSTVDLSVLKWPDNAVSEMESDPLISMVEVDMTQFEGYANVPEDQLMVPTANFNFVTRNDVGYDAIYETLSIMYENRESLSDYHNILSFHEDPTHWVENSYETVPFHPAAADFYEENDMWDLAKGGRADE
ncbi:TAXI family TRAP transporter solute-binding subunit [Natrinema sp. H-ect4]|uniref:TAXI family TRAP transporter solute-binding subunit n=1 Tax=Natrinema sp. H-ect4 TaxID=3242699 RepID=UPI0035A8746A